MQPISRPKLLAILAALLFGGGVVYLVEPRIEVSVGAPPDPARAILTPFVVSNGGFFSFRDVRLQCVAREAEFDVTTAPATLPPSPPAVHVTSVLVPRLPRGQQARVTCSKGLDSQPGTLRHADVDLNLCLKLYPVIDYISLVHFRYVGERGADGAVRWTQQTPRRTSIPWLAAGKEAEKPECEWAE